jgi:hypothetical protein
MASKNKKRTTSVKVSSAGEVAQVTKAPRRSAVTEFNPDYSYVKKDLARIGILAGSFFVVLVALSFFLR